MQLAFENCASFKTDRLRVTKRQRTGVGKYVYFDDPDDQRLPNGFYSSADGCVAMSGIPGGLLFGVFVHEERIACLELVTLPPDAWDGVEREWSIPPPSSETA